VGCVVGMPRIEQRKLYEKRNGLIGKPWIGFRTGESSRLPMYITVTGFR